MSEQPQRPDVIWCFDVNRRVYRSDGRGGPIWREHWRPIRVVGETSRSWLLERPFWAVGRTVARVPKVGAHPHLFAFSETELNEREYVEVHRHAITERVRRCDDPAVMRQIASLVGYAPTEAPK